MVSIWDVPREVWNFGRKLEDLMALQAKTEIALHEIRDRLAALEQRTTYLEADRSQLVTEARAAAGVAGTNMATIIVSEVITRVTRLEMRQDELQKRLPLG